MSLANIKTKTQEGLNDIYTALEEKSATIPEQKNLINVAPAIRSITGGDNSGEYVWAKYSNYTINENIKLLMPFDGNVKDLTGKNVPTIVGNNTYGVGKFGKAKYFNGSTDYISMPYTSDINIDTGDFTIAFWTKTLNTEKKVQVIFANDLGTTNGIRIFMYSTTELSVKVNGDNVAIKYSGTIPTNEWLHIAVVRKGNNFYLYVNGEQKGTATYTGTMLNEGTLCIGANKNSSGIASPFNGYIDDLIITKTALWENEFTPPTIPFEIESGTFEEYVVSDNENAYPNNDYGDDGFYYIKEIDKQEPEQPQVHNYLMLYDGTLGEAGENGANVCVDVTGGWEANNSEILGSDYLAGQVNYNIGNISFLASKNTGEQNRQAGIITRNTVNMSEYKKIGALIYPSLTNPNKYNWGAVVVSQNKVFSTGEYVVVMGSSDLSNVNNKKVLKSADISNMMNKNNYLTAYVSTTAGNSPATMNFYSSFLVKQDDYQPILDLAGITTTYTDEASICASQTAMTAILNNKEAIDYMVHNCTGTFMLAFLQTETALNALNSSPYKVLVYQNDVWIKFLSMVA